MSLNKANMLKWIEALESGNYEQCSGKLTKISDDGKLSHCCLGVATEVALANGLEGLSFETRTDNGSTFRAYCWLDAEGNGDNQGSWLPEPVRSWLGTSPWGDVELDNLGLSASAANDRLGWDFTRIAAALRAKYLAD